MQDKHICILFGSLQKAIKFIKKFFDILVRVQIELPSRWRRAEKGKGDYVTSANIVKPQRVLIKHYVDPFLTIHSYVQTMGLDDTFLIYP